MRVQVNLLYVEVSVYMLYVLEVNLVVLDYYYYYFNAFGDVEQVTVFIYPC